MTALGADCGRLGMMGTATLAISARHSPTMCTSLQMCGQCLSKREAFASQAWLFHLHEWSNSYENIHPLSFKLRMQLERGLASGSYIWRNASGP